MLLSMTGFGAADAVTPSYHVKVEVRTLNSKFLDAILRVPRELADKELEIRNLINAKLKRGKVNFSIELQQREQLVPKVKINQALFQSYYNQFVELAQVVNADQSELFKLAIQSPDVITNEDSSKIDEWEEIKACIEAALDKCNEFRQHEGAVLQQKLTEYIDVIDKGLIEVTEQDSNRITQIRERINTNLDEIRERVKVDENRFEQELIYYIEKIDITEEKVRLKKHLEYFGEIMADPESQGKKLGFVSQEIGREINTIGAKANDAVIQRAVVVMKDELEKIKEQSMNIL